MDSTHIKHIFLNFDLRVVKEHSRDSWDIIALSFPPILLPLKVLESYAGFQRIRCHVCHSAIKKVKPKDRMEAERSGEWTKPALTGVSGASAGCALASCRKVSFQKVSL